MRGEDSFNAYKEMIGNLHPIGRTGTSDECARTAAFLANEPFLTGVILPVDGGLSKKPGY